MSTGFPGLQFLRPAQSVLLLVLISLPASAQSTPSVTPELLEALRWRSIGPAVFGGRIADVAGIPGNPYVFYLAHSSAGLYKTTNGGITFQSIFDNEGTLSMGAMAIAPDDPNVLYAGTGEGKPRNSASFGDGIYKSVDGGKTWQNLGLRSSERFARIAIDPQHPQIVFAAAMGHEWGASDERGVFRSTDGGQTWKRVLFTNATSGASDVGVDPKNPQTVFAGLYDYQRQPWHFRSGGPGSGLYRSADGGESWKKLNDPGLPNGLPQGILGRIGLAVAPSNPKVVYAMIENAGPGRLWRSADGGDHWTMVSDRPEINTRGFYFSAVRVDPVDENRVYALSGGLLVSTDGGRNFRPIGGRIHGDHHALWIDPSNPNRLLNGSDGGFQLSNDRGATWDFINTLPLAQVYHVHHDMEEPYNVLAGFQDNELWRGPSTAWNQTGVLNGDWRRIVNWGDGMHALADPRDSNIIYLVAHYGDVSRVDWRTGERRFLTPYPVIAFGSAARAHRYRFNWNSPLTFSASNPNLIYFGGNVLFASRDRGETWQVLSPDLTSNDPEKMKISGDPLIPDMTIAEFHCTITAIADSPLDANVIWVGTDDGNVQLTRNGGKTWTNVARQIPGLAPSAWVESIAASPHDAATAVVALDRHALDDFAPYIFLTRDYGKTWTKITDGLRGYVHVVRQDRKEPKLLYAGTELGVFASFDSGRSWTDLRLGLPPLPVYDLDVHPRDNDLILGTHARGIYILDDVTPLQALAQRIPNAPVVFEPVQAIRHFDRPERGAQGDRVFASGQKPSGATISFFIPPKFPVNRAHIEVVGSAERLVRRYEVTLRPGINRMVWDLAEGVSPTVIDPSQPLRNRGGAGGYLWFGLGDARPKVLPGKYRVRLVAGSVTSEQTLMVRSDPRRPVPQPELVAQRAALVRLAATLERVRRLVENIDGLHRQLAALDEHPPSESIHLHVRSADALLGQLSARLLNTQGEYRAPAQLRENLMQLFRMISSYDGAPTHSQLEATEKFEQQLRQLADEYAQLTAGSLGKLNAELKAANAPAITVGR